MTSLDAQIRLLAEKQAKNEIKELKVEWAAVIAEIERDLPADHQARFLFSESHKPAPLRIMWEHCLALIAEHQTEVFVDEMTKQAAQRLLKLVKGA